ncbi:MAG: alpha/beta fold hydrolase, partial [Bdellovibrionales bacterium]|nr:alpha/beta fold hydrolase [Bdellovibrionales bacterium]
MSFRSFGYEIRPGQSISGDYFSSIGTSPVDTLVILCHGFTAFRRYAFFPDLARAICDLGVGVVSIDFPGNGVDAETGEFVDIESFSRNTVQQEVDDLTAFVESVVERGCSTLDLPPIARVILFGHSRGGLPVIECLAKASTHRALQAGILWSVPSDIHPMRFGLTPELEKIWREHGSIPYPVARIGQSLPLHLTVLEELLSDPYRVERHAKELQLPVLIVHGEEDPTVPVACGARIHEWIHGSTFVSVSGADHVFNFSSQGATVGEYVR